MLEMLEIEPRSPASAAVIWLHGLGADGHDFEPLVRDWGLADQLGTRFVLPHAPRRPVTLNAGMVMPAWYDIQDIAFDRKEDVEGIEQARQSVLELLARECARGIPPQRIVLAGFSQGGAIALHTALRAGMDLAGVLVLSAYLPLADSLHGEKQADPETLTVRMDHGTRDQVVPFHLAELSRDRLLAEGFRVDFNDYEMEHGLCLPQIDSLRGWLLDRLG